MINLLRRLALWWSERDIRKDAWRETHKDDWDQHDVYW